MAPGDVAHVPRSPSPVAVAGLVAEHFRSRARLCRLLVRLRQPTPSPPALRATPGGASLTTFGFVTTVPRYLPKASNSLTFVRGADRACCAPRKWPWKPTMLACTGCPHAPRKGHWRAHPAAAPCRRGACRAYCAPRKRRHSLIIYRLKGNVALLIVLAADRCFACARRPGSSALPLSGGLILA